jgi:hypothetical protein
VTQSNGTAGRNGPPLPRRGSGVDLGAFLDEQVLPRLTAEAVFTHDSHRWQKDGDKWRGGCPWHKSKSGTAFYIDARTLSWRCPACGPGVCGGPVQYRWQLRGGKGSPRGKDFVDVVRELAELAGVEFPERPLTPQEQEAARRRDLRRALLEAVSGQCEALLWSKAGEAALANLRDRGFTDEDLRSLGCGLYPDVDVLRAALVKAGFSRDDIKTACVLSARMVGYATFPWPDDRGVLLTLYGHYPAKTPPDGKPKKMALPNPGERGDP